MPHIEGSSPLLSILFTDVRMQVRVPAYSTHLQNLAWRGNQYAGTVLNHSPQWLWFMAEEKTGDCNARIEGATPDRDGSSGRDVMLEQRRP